MKESLYSIKDTVTDEFGAPWPAKNDVIALRHFNQLQRREDPHNSYHTHATDYELWRVGTFDSDTGDVQNSHAKLHKGGTP